MKTLQVDVWLSELSNPDSVQEILDNAMMQPEYQSWTDKHDEDGIVHTMHFGSEMVIVEFRR